MVKKKIKIGESTQEDVIKLFGSPDNMISQNGREIWIYDRFRVETATESSSAYGIIILLVGSSRKSSSYTTVRNLTVIIDFDKDGIVKELRMRQGGY